MVDNPRVRASIEAAKRRIAAIPQAVGDSVKAQLEANADDLVATMKRYAPVSDLEQHPGQLRDSIHKYPGKHEMQVRVIADARDEKGRAIGAHVEHGHMSPAGKHVAARTFFFPVYRAMKKGMRRKLLAAGRKAAKAAFENGG